MAEAVELAALHDPATVDQALGQAATAGRFRHGDLTAILTHTTDGRPAAHRAGEHNSLAQGTAGWARLGEHEQGWTDMTDHKIARIMLDAPADDPNQLVGVPAGELFEWAWLAADLADWLDHAADTTRHDFGHFFGGLGSPGQTAVFLAQIAERIAALLDGDRGQP